MLEGNPVVKTKFCFRKKIYAHCAMHKGNMVSVSTRCGNAEDKEESEIISNISVSDYQSSFIPYGLGWNWNTIRGATTHELTIADTHLYENLQFFLTFTACCDS